MSKTIFLIAGEHSGDALGGRLMAALRAKGEVRFSGVGGPMMVAQGLSSLVPMGDLCVMGLVEVFKHYPRLKKLGMMIIEEIEKAQPDVVVTIDLPDFNFRVAKLLKQRGIFKGKIVHYVAPTVWAWRPGRAKKIAKFLDGLMCLFPFEPKYFTKHGLQAEFVGHSLVESGIVAGDGSRFRERYELRNEKCIGLFFGSRQREIETIGPVLKDVAQKIATAYPQAHLIVPTMVEFEPALLDLLVDVPLSATFVTDAKGKWDAFKACDAAVAVSGTVGLELAYAGVPHVIAYKMNVLSWVLVRLLVRTKYAHLVNILLDKPVVPEFLQDHCTAERIAAGVEVVLNYPLPQKKAFESMRGMLLPDAAVGPSEKAAGFVLSV